MSSEQPDEANAAERRTFLLVTGDGAIAGAARELLAPAGTLQLCEGVEEALRRAGAAPVIVPVQAAPARLQAALAQGGDPGRALDAWRDETEALLRLCRKARRRIVLIDADTLRHRPAALAGALRERLGLAAVGDGAADAVGTAPSTGDSLSFILAAALFSGDAKAQALADELDAMLQGPAGARHPGRADAEDAAREMAGMAAETAALHEERALLRESLAKQGAADEQRRARERTLEDELAGLRRQAERAAEEAQAQLAGLRAERDALEERLTTAMARREAAQEARETEEAPDEEEMREVGDRLAEVTEERDMLRASLQQMFDQADRLEQARQALEEKAHALGQGLADRHLLHAQLGVVTRQLDDLCDRQQLREAVLGAEILQAAAGAQAERAQMLRDAAHERETHAHQLAQARAEAAALSDSVSEFKDAQARLEAEAATQAQELAGLREERDRLQAELAHVYHSTSWKVTGPMRAIRQNLKGETSENRSS